ncbi:LysR family transcriptional regulator [Bradyrhizobium sp. CCBAU 51745]|uniref:LysR family transcriptional regulator n=1 Tax=Bradyrhizobium sp. CCBAU 51745 TaxID=1325099 RepID=UPI0023051869|nr:LysR family transcriptional regulator [Bradyrhizobium sp. CCBAU 51745]
MDLGFSAAGDQLGLTSSAVSQLVSELEAITGFRVFDRSTRRVALSSAVREFLGIAQTVLRHVQLAETAADSRLVSARRQHRRPVRRFPRDAASSLSPALAM